MPPVRTPSARARVAPTAAAHAPKPTTATARRGGTAHTADRLDAPRRTTGERAPAGDRAWAKLETALLAHPTESTAEIAARVGLDEPGVTRLIAQHGGPQAVWARRDRVAAEKLAQLAHAHPDAGSFRELARLAQDALPGLQSHNIPKLKQRHPELLAHLEARSISAPLPPPIRARIAELALAHPTLDYAALAKLFGADPKLKGVLKWSEAEVSHLREPSRIVPSERKREAALVALATAHLTRAKGELDAAIAKLDAAHPGVTRARIVELAAHHPPLAQQIRRLDAGQTTSAPPTVELDRATALAAELGPSVLERALAAAPDGLVAELTAALAQLDRDKGNNDGIIAPRELAGAPPELAQVMARVHARIGKKVHPLAKITAALPEAIAHVAHVTRRDPKMTLHLRATEEALGHLSRAYHAEVIEGGGTAIAFHGGQKIVSKQWTRMRAAAPDLFPAPDGLSKDAGRTEAIAQLYQQLLGGELTTGGFYMRAKITAPELRLLQASDPARFPRQAGAASWKTVVGRREARTLDVAAMSSAYKSDVLTGDRTLREFLRTFDVSPHRFAALRAKHPKQFPALGRWGGKTPDDVLAKAIGARARAELAKDVLRDVAEIITLLNQDAELVDLVGGPINRSRYEALRKNFPGDFPEFKKPELFLPVLAEEVRALLEDDPSLTPVGITQRMRELHPNFRLTRVYQLREAYPDLIPGQAPRPTVDRKADAEILAARMKADPSRSLLDIADDLSAVSPRFDVNYLRRLRKSFASTVFDDAAIAYKTRPIARESVTAGELLSLAVRLAPPGANEQGLSRAVDALLEARGLPVYGGERPAPGLTKAMTQRHGGVEAQNIAVVAEVAAEYAAAAPKGATEKQIFDAILADYPTLDQQKLSTYKAAWAKSVPTALRSFAKGGALTLRGQGRTIEAPRYLGGWDVERALLGPARTDRALATSLSGLAAHARMPLRLPLLDKMVGDLNGKEPLRHKNLLWVTHILASTYALSVALRQTGLAAARSVVVGTPYGTNDTVRETLAGDGFDVRKPKLDTAAYRAEVERAIDDVVKLHAQNHQPIVVLDDGGLVAEILRSSPKYAHVRGAFKIVEQTTRGITAAEQDVVDLPVINVARSKSKIAEGALIGRAVAAKVLQGLRRVGKDLAGTQATVVGYGTIGAQIAGELRLRGALVSVVEPSADRAKQAAKDGFTVATKAVAFKSAQVVIGATGHTSIELDDLRRLPAGAVVASASSKRLEIDMTSLEKASSDTRTIVPDSPLVTLPTRAYALGKREITVLGDGWPVNFDGDVEDIPPEEIQLTRAVMLAGAIQAASVQPHRAKSKGIIPLDPALDQAVLSGFRALMRGRKEQSPIGDPDRWADVLRATEATVRDAIEG